MSTKDSTISTDLKEKTLKYHSFPQPGKIKVVPTKSCANAEELSLIYQKHQKHFEDI